MNDLLRTSGKQLLSKVLEKTIENIETANKESQTNGTYRNLIVHTFFTAVAIRNEYATKLMYDVACELHHEKFFRHEVKKYIKEAEREKSNYNSLTNGFAYNEHLIDYLDEISDKFTDMISNACDNLYKNIRSEMMNAKVKKADLFAKIEMVAIVLDTTIKIFDDEMNSDLTMMDTINQFSYMKLEKLRDAWKKACHYIYKDYFPYEVNLNNKKCKDAYKGMMNAMRNYEFILDMITVDKNELNEEGRHNEQSEQE